VIKHFVFNDTVIVYNQPQSGGGNVMNADSTLTQAGRLLNEGSISLQSESHPVDFRKVELFDLQPYVNDPVKLEAVLRNLQKRKK
jgi:hypothetical protein